MNGWTSKLIFKVALHMPDLAANLVSIGKFDDMGFLVTFAGGKACFMDPAGNTFMTGEKRHRMYCLEFCLSLTGLPATSTLSHALSGCKDNQKTSPKALVASSLDKLVPLNVWHRRFNHTGIQLIRKLESKQLVDRFHVKGLVSASGMCEDCIYRKQTTWPYDGTSEDIQTASKKVYIDLWGPAPIASLGGALYLIMFTDTGSSCLHGEYLANKAGNMTLVALKSYVTEVEHQTGNKLKVIQVNNGQEWVNHLWHRYCCNTGINLTTVVPYAHA